MPRYAPLRPELSPEPTLLTRSPRVLSAQGSSLGVLRSTLLAIGAVCVSACYDQVPTEEQCPSDYWYFDLESVEVLSISPDRSQEEEVGLWPEDAYINQDAVYIDIDEIYLLLTNPAEVDTGPEDTGRQNKTLECQTP